MQLCLGEDRTRFDAPTATMAEKLGYQKGTAPSALSAGSTWARASRGLEPMGQHAWRARRLVSLHRASPASPTKNLWGGESVRSFRHEALHEGRRLNLCAADRKVLVRRQRIACGSAPEHETCATTCFKH